MNINKNNKKRSGFTLIELLTVIAIIGILAGILIPTIGLVRKNAAKTKSASDLRQIATAYNAYALSGPRARTINVANMGLWAETLSTEGGFNEGAGYFVDSATDVVALASIPQTILDSSGAATALWTTAAGAGAISYNAAINLPPNSRGTITPLIWTKGVGGTAANLSVWDADSPWQGEGGHIAYLDSHVVFYTDLTGELQDTEGAAVDNVISTYPTVTPAIAAIE